MSIDFAADILAFIIFSGIVYAGYQKLKTGKWPWK